MENLRIRVNNEAESKEAQELFFELGYSWNIKGGEKDYLNIRSFTHLTTFDKHIGQGFGFVDHKKITLPELRDLVVLKRNDVGDATHESSCGELKFILLGDWWNLFTGGKWQQVSHKQSPRCNKLKPIEKPMKEYLRKNNDGEYILEVTDEREAQEPHAKHWIEVPSGMNIYWKEDGDYWFTTQVMGYRGAKIIWQRTTHPEELPFIDDEPLQSLNDQYAEIEKVRQTLNQRQEQYGSFEDVAMLTEQMVDVMRKGYYEKLAYNQKMALYMICSKMARIVNGNPNHKDSWHDIAGYATLIDNELVSEKDMPF